MPRYGTAPREAAITTGEKHIPLAEIGSPEPVEIITDLNLNSWKEAELEAFMNELVTIRVHPTAEEGALMVETPSVNGVNMPMIRGEKSTVKRKYVEALAHATKLTYRQEQRNPADLSQITMVERRTLAYPFEVLHDPNPNGAAWLENILNAEM